MTKRVLLTGAGGFVGSHLLETLLDQTDYHVVCLDSFRHNGITDRVAAAVGDRRARVTVLTHDLCARLSPTMYEHLAACESIINPASFSQVDQSIKHPDEFIRNNIESLLTVLEVARRLDIRLTHVSTDEVYGPHAPATAWEHRPSSPYAASKAAQEDICHAYARTYDLEVRLVTSANMFGERQSQLAFIPRALRQLRAGTPVRVHTQDGVPGRRRYTYVRNVAEHIVDSLGYYVKPGTAVKSQLCGQEELDNVDVVRMLAYLLDTPPHYELVDVRAERPGYDESYAQLSPAPTWQPRHTLENGLKRTVRWALDNPEWLSGNTT